jgi:hypothetical protein
MQEADYLDIAIRRDMENDEMTGGAAPPPNVEGANPRANFIARATGGVLLMLKQLGEGLFDQGAILRALS